VNRLDEARGPRIVAEDTAQLANRLAQGDGRDRDLAPDGIEQLVRLDEHPWALRQIAEHSVGFRPHLDRTLAPPQALVAQIEPKGRERDAPSSIRARNRKPRR
jgi:hypothetical protein